MAWNANLKKGGQQEISKELPSFESIFEIYYRRIYHYLYYRVSNAHQAEDLTSQVFEKVLTGFYQYRDDRAPFEVWLFTIARNVVNDHYRREKRQGNACPLEFIPEPASADQNPEALVEGAESRQQLLAAVKSLTAAEQHLIALKFGAGLKNTEIAALMEISESNVGVMLYRSMKKLKAKLEKEVY